MIYNYFQISKKQNQMLTSLLQSENPDVINLKLKKKISKLNEFQHFNLFFDVFIKTSFHPFIKEGFSHFTKTLDKTHNEIDVYFPRSNFNTSDSETDYFLVFNCKKDLQNLVHYYLNTKEYPRETLITKLLVVKENILKYFIDPLSIILPTFKNRLQKSDKLYNENTVYLRDLINELEDIEEKYQNYINEIDSKINSFSREMKGNYLIDINDELLKKLYQGLNKYDFIDIDRTSEEDFIKVFKSDWKDHNSVIHFKITNVELKFFIKCFNEDLNQKIPLTFFETAGNIKTKDRTFKASNLYSGGKQSENNSPNIKIISSIFEKIKKH